MLKGDNYVCKNFNTNTFILYAKCSSDSKTIVGSVGKKNTELGIENVIPSELGSVYKANFNRYTYYETPNGGKIHIVAQSNISENQIVRCRNILSHFLTNFSGSAFGANKDEIANKMAENGTILCLLNGEDNEENPVVEKLTGQPLFENEVQVEGHPWYINQNYSHRDAAYEEILHLVHDYGIGVDGVNSNPGAASQFLQKIRAAQINAIKNNLWGRGANEWIEELTEENSLSQEYLAFVIDSYYGLWGAFTENNNGGMWGIYTAKTRKEIINKAPMGYKLMELFFHPYLTYNARIDSSFEGTFSLKFNNSLPYTHHSRYLKDITLTGAKNVNVRVNKLNNKIIGNEGKNTIIFSGSSLEYTVSYSKTKTIVTDTITNRDGNNELTNINFLQFTDKTIEIEKQ